MSSCSDNLIMHAKSYLAHPRAVMLMDETIIPNTGPAHTCEACAHATFQRFPSTLCVGVDLRERQALYSVDWLLVA